MNTWELIMFNSINQQPPKMNMRNRKE
jgi:hypothetical protein